MKRPSRNDVTMLTGIVVALLVMFQRPIQYSIQLGRDFEDRYGLAFLPGLAVLCVVLSGHFFLNKLSSASKRRQTEQTSRLVVLGQALAKAGSMNTLRNRLRQYLPEAVGVDGVWAVIRVDERWVALTGGMPSRPEVAAAELKRFSKRPCTTWGGRGTSARTDAGGPMRAYSMDLRERALLDSDAGMKAADVAAKYRVSGSWVRLLKQRRRDTGEVAPRVQRHGRRGMLEPHLHTLAALMAAHPDRTLAELKDALATPASVPTVWRAVRALGLTVTKNGPPVRTRSA